MGEVKLEMCNIFALSFAKTNSVFSLVAAMMVFKFQLSEIRLVPDSLHSEIKVKFKQE